jgi:ssDNA-binding Zn-finger/Zn-ribbon topoisomerase 1
MMPLFPADGSSSDGDGLSEDKANCPECGTTLDLHQPDPFQPERMLGICPDCKTWVLIDVGDYGQFYYSRLPRRPR